MSCSSGNSNLNNHSRVMELLRKTISPPSALPHTNVMTTVQRSSASSFPEVRTKYYIQECNHLGQSLGLTYRLPQMFLWCTTKAPLGFLSYGICPTLVLFSWPGLAPQCKLCSHSKIRDNICFYLWFKLFRKFFPQITTSKNGEREVLCLNFFFLR